MRRGGNTEAEKGTRKKTHIYNPGFYQPRYARRDFANRQRDIPAGRWWGPGEIAGQMGVVRGIPAMRLLC